MQESMGFGESVSVEVIRAKPELVKVLTEVIQKNWMLILIIAFIIYFIWKSKQKKEAKVWQF